ncbi:1-acyl-sn-glycerol-3-phosphate acyltransferase [Bradyrhizobium sp. 200]|uniref:lysophospholipid acyltransferase family protein n=1 Tax=Bradyrhizobium sp. 200 TaxID=2782665 RepID=UPI001FFE7E1D|nr:lysophospholipid acyltransferase family protein [Bradyrhizobium sp. 200]UPJ51471.1 1-acyl-sn-glycerol-3-phosphate acyltransferase [Bradyrhizobium sp. 200]
MIDILVGTAVTGFARAVTGVRGEWQGCAPEARPRVYFANHSSMGDFILVWTVLPPALRRNTRPVAGSDYWNVNATRRFFADRVFHSVLIDRNWMTRKGDPVKQMTDALDAGASLILFPEGTRNMTEERLLPFKSGLYHLAMARPQVELVPVWLENLNRMMPKGEIFPVPLLCTVTFGAPLTISAQEDKSAFLERARAALLAAASARAAAQ